MWFNKVTNQCQTIAPWGTGHLHPDLIAEQYGDWEMVDEGFNPPAPKPTIAEQVTALNAEYDPRRVELKQNLAYVASYYQGNTTKYDAAKAKLDALNAEYIQRLGVITSGND